MNSPVFFLTDFGYKDTYVAQMKAAVLSFSGYNTPLIDLTHSIEGGNILQGAYHLAVSLPNLPEGSVTVAVVDPGVGSARKAIVARWNGRFIVAADNGIISLLHGIVETWVLPQFNSNVSSTFHGRDIFAPAAARLLIDPGWIAFLEVLKTPVLIDVFRVLVKDKSLQVPILHVDNFGNCILATNETSFLSKDSLLVLIEKKEYPVLGVEAYFEADTNDTLLALVGSSGFIELAFNGSSAAKRLGLIAGDKIIFKWNGEL